MPSRRARLMPTFSSRDAQLLTSEGKANLPPLSTCFTVLFAETGEETLADSQSTAERRAARAGCCMTARRPARSLRR
jgi:hypothetical protein